MWRINGRPINNRHFGNYDNRIAITYKVEGTEYVGYIVKQLLTSEYCLTIDGFNPMTEGDIIFVIQQIKDVIIGESSGTAESEPTGEIRK